MEPTNYNIKKGNMILILFKAKPKSQTFVAARYNEKGSGKWQQYHISSKMDAESLTTNALCGSCYFVNWGVGVVMVTQDELRKIIQTDSKPLCKKCAMAIVVIKIEEKS